MIQFRSRKTPPTAASRSFPTLWTNFEFCQPITALSITFVHASRPLQSILRSFSFGYRLPCTLPQHQQEPNCKLLCGAKVVLAQGTWFGRRSDSPVLTFGRLEFSLNEHDVAPKGLQQPGVRLFLNRAGEPSRLLQLRQT